MTKSTIYNRVPFDVFMSQLLETNATLDFFCDFSKISENVDKIAMKLHQLNYLIGKEDMTAAVTRLWSENPSVFEVLDILVAVRSKDGKKVLTSDGNLRLLVDFFHTAEDVVEYLEGTGLSTVLREKKITNLVDYVFGIETGLDSNARKNRSGKIMEKRVRDILVAAGIEFRQEVYSSSIKELSCLGVDLKRFDFVIETPRKTYLIEVNFYGSGGSKLNEVARSYTEIAEKINTLSRYEFVWITDGQGWNSARNKLEAAYSSIPSVYNLTSISSFIYQVQVENS